MMLTPINPALLKVEWIFTMVRTIKMTHFPCKWLRHLSMRRPWGFSKIFKENKKIGTEKANLSSLVYHSDRQLCSYFPPWCPVDSHSFQKTLKSENVGSQLKASHSSTGSQSTPSCREVPWWGLLPTARKAILILLVCCRKMLQFVWAPTDFFSLDSSTDEPKKKRRINKSHTAVWRMSCHWIPLQKPHTSVCTSTSHSLSWSLVQCPVSVGELLKQTDQLTSFHYYCN